MEAPLSPCKGAWPPRAPGVSGRIAERAASAALSHDWHVPPWPHHHPASRPPEPWGISISGSYLGDGGDGQVPRVKTRSSEGQAPPKSAPRKE